MKTMILLFGLLFASNAAIAEKYIGVNGPGVQLMSGARVDIGAENIVHWAGLNVSWMLNANGAGDGLTFTQTQTAVQAAFNSWQNVSTSDITFTSLGSTTATWSNDQKNVHFWGESGDPIFNYIGSGVLAITIITINAAEEMLDVDIVFNGRDYTWMTNGNDYDIEAVSVHEIGHLLGLHHTEVTSSPLPTMYASYHVRVLPGN